MSYNNCDIKVSELHGDCRNYSRRYVITVVMIVVMSPLYRYRVPMVVFLQGSKFLFVFLLIIGLIYYKNKNGA